MAMSTSNNFPVDHGYLITYSQVVWTKAYHTRLHKGFPLLGANEDASTRKSLHYNWPMDVLMRRVEGRG